MQKLLNCPFCGGVARLESRSHTFKKLLYWGQWVSVEDRLPMSNERVLIHSDCGTIQIAYITGRKNEWRKIGVTPVTHWQPLPEPPEK